MIYNIEGVRISLDVEWVITPSLYQNVAGEFMSPIMISFAIYLLMMVGIGLWAYFRTSNLDDYILGGRSLGPWVTALSAAASDMSGWALLGLPGAVYANGLKGNLDDIWTHNGGLLQLDDSCPKT